mgnify:FL=1
MEYNKGDKIKVQIANINDIGAFVKLEGRASGMIHYSEVPCKFGQVSNYLEVGQDIEVIILGPGKPDKFGNPRYNLSKKKVDEQTIREQVAVDIDNLAGEEKSIREIWKIFTQINKCLLQYMKQPILLDVNSAKLHRADGKLVIKANTESKFELFQKSFKQRFNTELIPAGKDSWNFYANIDTISTASLKAFEEECECLYMNFFPQPYIEGKIWNYKKDKREGIENQLSDCFPNIVIVANKQGELSFRQAYSSHSQARDFFIALRDILKEIQEGSTVEDEDTGETKEYEPIPFDFEIFPLEEQDKFYIERNVFGQQEHEAVVIGTLRGEIFSCDGIEVGKLKNVNYPVLTFVVEKEKLDAVEKLVSEKQLTMVSTDLTGDSEKVNRLQESFDFITENFEQLRNPMLASYLFDASKATPTDEKKVKERIEHIEANQLNKHLNEWQIEAIAKAVEAKDLAVIQGPPGTGKSTAIAELIWQLALANPKDRTLLTSEANLAVDNALDRLKFSDHNIVKPIRIGAGDKFSSEGLPYAITEMMKWADIDFSKNYILSEDNRAIEESDEYKLFNKENNVLVRWMKNIINRSQIQDETIERAWFHFMLNLPVEFRKKVFYSYRNNCNVIGATCSSITEKNYAAIESQKEDVVSRFMKRYKNVFKDDEHLAFDVVVQDEASKATPSELSMPLVYGTKSIIIGDHRQLPPNLDREDILYKLHYQALQTVDVEEKEQIIELEKFVRYHFDQLEKSHFERLFTQADNSIKGTFRKQYRMHPDINKVIEQFYTKDGGLECGFINEDYESEGTPFSRYHGINIDGLISPENHVIWIDTNSPEIAEGTSRTNRGEVDAIEWVLSQLATSDSFEAYNNKFSNEEDKEIGLITFYGAQLRQLRQLQDKYSGKLTLKPSSVDRFQGMERNIVIVSLVRSNCIAENEKQAPDYRVYKELGFRKQTDFGFAKSPNRLNVALSRAKRLLIIVGNSAHYSSYKNKEGEAIYKNVFESIKTNPNGKIIHWEHKIMKKRPRPISKNRSANLNTRDINPETDGHLRVIETWLRPNANRTNPKIAVLELSTKAVKCLIGKDQELIRNANVDEFNFQNFIRNANKTETGKGLDSQNDMNMRYFEKNVLPTIRNWKRVMMQENVDVVYTVATAAYRTARNRDEIVAFIKERAGINVRILSKKEESVSTMFAYLFSSRYKQQMLTSEHVIMIDQGGGSTEVSVFQNSDLVSSYSINLGTTALRNILFLDSDRDTPVYEALKRSDQKIKERLVVFYKNMGDAMTSETESFCISVGTAITHATGGKNNAAQHDRVMTREKIEACIETCTQAILDQFDTVDQLNEYDFESSRGSKRLDDQITMRLGLPMFLSLMDRFNIKEIHVSGTGLWYGIYLQHLHNIADN